MSNEKFIGLWLWKPFIIIEASNKLEDGDILFYVGAGNQIISDSSVMIQICSSRSDIILCGNSNDLNVAWTKRDCFVLMDCDTERYWYSSHCDASFMVFKKSSISSTFPSQWLTYGSSPSILTNSPNKCGLPNLPEYVDHRYDQLILSILAEKFNLPLYKTPSQFGNHYKIREYREPGEFNCVNQSNQNILHHYYFIPYYNSPYKQLVNHHRKKYSIY